MIRIGSQPPEPGGYKTTTIDGEDVYELASEIDRFHSVATGEPSDDVMVASGERAEYAMPAAAMAARSGDAVLFAKRDELPAASVDALKRHEKPDVFIVGPETVVGTEVEKQLKPLARRVRAHRGRRRRSRTRSSSRASQSGSFGWGAEVPGQNFTIASTSRPLDAVARRLAGDERRVRAAPPDRRRRDRCRARSRATCSTSSRASRTTRASASSTTSGSWATTTRSRSSSRAGSTRSPRLIPVQVEGG